MGMEQAVTFPQAIPTWIAVQALLAGRGYPVQMRMIDGQLAFPDETPPDAWHELRIGTPQGMVTVRREDQRLVFVTWGNADAEMRQAWNAVTWAFAECGGGKIQREQQVVGADGFAQDTELPAVLRLQ
jgi:hypothetical protein